MRSDNVTKGSERAPNRSLFYALGYTPEELERPLIGVVSAHSEIVPGHMNLDKIAEAVKAGVQMAGGTPILIPAIGVCDGIAMGHVGMKYSLASRELICDSMEPRIQDGDLALVHKQDTLENGDLGVLIYGDEGEGTLKRYIQRGNCVVLQPFNPAYHEMVIKGEDLNHLHIAGRVVETKAKW